MFVAAKWFDPVIGVDLHRVMVPAPPSPTPVPPLMPHAFVRMVFDPLGAAISAGLSRAGGGGAVYINGLPVSNSSNTSSVLKPISRSEACREARIDPLR